MSWSGSWSQTFVNPDNLVQAESEVDAFMDLMKRYVRKHVVAQPAYLYSSLFLLF